MSDVLAVLRWRDAIDMALLAAVIYRILVVFRGTRAVEIFVGLGLLIGATLLAREFELVGLAWLFDNFSSFWLVALVVLFQPELRRALGRVGQGRFVGSLTGASREERERVVREVATATEALASRRMGALIVMERGTGLRPYAELGVPLDALVSADLLVSLFPATSPLHDGAVLIRGTRVVAAGCFLPLSRTRDVGRALGTRHRAALGVTEEGDAVAVVVSEETGRLSIAEEGRLEVMPDAEAVRQRLSDLLGVTAPETSRSLARGVARFLRRA